MKGRGTLDTHFRAVRLGDFLPGADNRALRCPTANDPREQAVSGDVIFDQLEDISGKSIQTDGYHELKFRTGNTKSSVFKETCIAP